jgi:ATP-dependent Clp protease ATP-binding subunit ClpA
MDNLDSQSVLTSESKPIRINKIANSNEHSLLNCATDCESMGLEAIEYLSEKGNDLQFGARPVKRVIQRDVLNQLSKEILAGTITTDSIVLIDASDGKLVFRNQSELVS